MNEPHSFVSGGALKGRKILVVEGERFVASGLCRAIAEAGGAVLGPLPDGGCPASRDYDIALLEIGDGGESVVALAETVQWHGIPVVFATRRGLAARSDRLRHIPIWLEPYWPAHLVFGLAMILDLRSAT